MQQLNQSNFDSEVLQANTPVFVEFGADWCGPCKRLEPVLDKLQSDHPDKIKVFKVNAEDDQSLAVKYKVQGLPTIVVFKNGEMVDRKQGFQSEAKLVALMNSHA